MNEKECPVCGLMSAEEADTCKHGGTAFFFQPESLEPPFDDPADELVIIGHYSNLIEAHVIMALLESHDVAACIPEELTPGLFGVVGASPVERITVRVTRRYADMARRIITEGKSS